MKIIDLLNKIANGEEVPKKIRYQANSHKLDLYTYNEYTGDYSREIGIDLFTYLFTKERITGFLNDEVEIIEEDKKIKRILTYTTPDDEDFAYEDGDKPHNVCIYSPIEKLFIKKINELLDEVNKMKELKGGIK